MTHGGGKISLYGILILGSSWRWSASSSLIYTFSISIEIKVGLLAPRPQHHTLRMCSEHGGMAPTRDTFELIINDAQVWSCGICGGQSGAGAAFLQVLWFPLPIFSPPIAPQSLSSIIWGLYNRPEVAALPSGLVCMRGGLLQPLHLDPQWSIVLSSTPIIIIS
jgi:hypothetical protein